MTQRLPFFHPEREREREVQELTLQIREVNLNLAEHPFSLNLFFVSFRCHNCFCIWDSTLHHAWVCLVSVGSWTSLYRILGVVHTSFGYTVTSGLHFSGFTDVVFCCSIVCDEFTTCSGLKESVCSLRYKSTQRRDWIRKELCIWLSRKRITRATLLQCKYTFLSASLN